MYNKMSRVIFNVVMYISGVAVLVPAFVLVLQFGILGSAAKSETIVETPLTIWLMFGTLFGGVAYLIALGVLAWKSQASCRWCLYCLTGYAIYIAVMIGYISAGDFTLQMRTSGLLSALSSNAQVLFYLTAPLVFVVLLLTSHTSHKKVKVNHG